jgi:predicted ferric reductase
MTTTAARRRAAPRRPPLVPRSTPRWWGGLAGTTAAASLVFVTALWLSNHGLQDLVLSGAGSLSSIGRLTGLYAADLLLIQVLLMARIPLAERAFGQDRLARWHRWTGFTSFHLMLAHILFITLGYAATDQSGPLDEIWNMIWTYPGMLLATAGTLLLLLVVVTSLRAARRRLRYESWHLLHLYAYLGAGLALPHQLWTGTDFTSSAAATAFWWTLYAVAAGAVVIYRLVLPAWRTSLHGLRVSKVVKEGHGITSIYLRGRNLHRLRVRAGQFFLWRFLDGPGWSRAHPFSLSADPRSGTLRITVKDLGDGSSRLARLKPGTRALIEGPYGKLTGDSYRGGPVVMLACGVGITPLLALLGELAYRPGEATLLYRARSPKEAVFARELEWYAANRGVRVIHLLGPRAGRPTWLPASLAAYDDVQVLRHNAPAVAAAEVYICGPQPWMEAARATVLAAGTPPERIHTEQFAW